MARPSMARHSSAVRRGPAGHGLARLGMAWLGIVARYGEVWLGMAGHGQVWHG